MQPHDELRRAHGRVSARGWARRAGGGSPGLWTGCSDPVHPNPPVSLPPPLQNGEILPLKTLTYVALGVTLAALLLTFLFLAVLRTLRSNQHGIRRNLTAALGLAQLVFLLGINQADLPVRCSSSPETFPSVPCSHGPMSVLPSVPLNPASAAMTCKELAWGLAHGFCRSSSPWFPSAP